MFEKVKTKIWDLLKEKVVSLAMMTNENHFKKIVEAQEKSVENTLKYNEKEFIFSRIQENGINFREKTSLSPNPPPTPISSSLIFKIDPSTLNQ